MLNSEIRINSYARNITFLERKDKAAYNPIKYSCHLKQECPAQRWPVVPFENDIKSGAQIPPYQIPSGESKSKNNESLVCELRCLRFSKE